MDSIDFKSSWNVMKGKLKENYDNLDYSDLDYIEVQEDELFERLKKKTGKTKQELLNEINQSI